MGGLVGSMSAGTITYSSTDVNVTGMDAIGGILGYMVGGEIDNSSSAGIISAGTRGKIVGMINGSCSMLGSNLSSTSTLTGNCTCGCNDACGNLAGGACGIL